MTHFRALIVDDEPLARETLRDLLTQDPEIELTGEYGDGVSALQAIRDQRPDLVFLDIEMPELGGLEVAAALAPTELPTLIFVTAFSQHAVSAFDVEALDYLVKPFSDRRLFAALERAKRRLREQRMGQLAEQIATLTAELGDAQEPAKAVATEAVPTEAVPTEAVPTKNPSASKRPANSSQHDGAAPYLSRIRVTTGGRTLIVKASDVDWIESDDCYARLHTQRGNHLVRASLSSFEERLDPRRFIRVHRGAIINLDRVVEIEHLFKGARNVVLNDGSRLRVSRSRQRLVDEVLAPKLGRI